MGTLEIEASPKLAEQVMKEDNAIDESELSQIEEVRLTVPNTDDPSLPVWTFRMWTGSWVATLPIGRFMASALPTTKFRVPGFGSREFSLNPGPFNTKEHVLITIFANAGSAFGSGTVYAVGIVTIIKAFYGRSISFLSSWLLIITTQVMGYGWAGILRKFVVEPAHMWWPSTLVQISLFRTLHEKEEKIDGRRRITRSKFFLIALICSFCCPLVSPFFAIVNVFIGYALIIYLVMPVSCWGLNLYNSKTFPIFSSDLFTAQGQLYNVSSIVNNKLELNVSEYEKLGSVHLSTFFAVTYGFGFATIASTVTHVALFYGREIYSRYRASSREKEDVHTRLMRNYKDIPSWWFYSLLAVSILVDTRVEYHYYIMGGLLPGQPITNVCFKTYGYMSMAQAVAFLSDFKLGHYMKIPPRSMFLVQFIGTMLAGTVNIGVACWLLSSVENKCHNSLPQQIVHGHARAIKSFSTHRLSGVWLDRNEFSARMGSTLHLTVLLGATGHMPPASPLNYTSWILVGTIFNFFAFRYRKQWWQRYNYILSAALDAGVAFMTVLLYIALGVEDKGLNWWGASPRVVPEHCDLASCPTAKGISVDGYQQRIRIEKPLKLNEYLFVFALAFAFILPVSTITATTNQLRTYARIFVLWGCPSDRVVFDASVIWGLLSTSTMHGISISWWETEGEDCDLRCVQVPKA
ncbi:Oligopeptide transporter 4 [Hibiscus syriacus]|uniref:Oligopeptide transporter 4 n=1 Tax=Hibiscus syriacus TaxID=106335 RepID=A0A6A2XSJ1_HIBSY|nr:Oligopeptide transporter 4 [Hibiscus syriacus]